MKRKILSGIALTTCLSLLLGCGSNNNNKTQDDESFKEEVRNIYRKKDVVDKTIPLRFYKSTPSIPYIEVGQYFKEFFKTKYDITKSGSFFIYKNRYGVELCFDAKNDLFACNQLVSLNSHPDFKSSTGKTFLKTINVESTTPQTKYISLKNYDIDFHTDEEKVYVPLSFLGKIAGGLALFNIAYNGKDVYVIDRNGQLGDTPMDAADFGDAYNEILDDDKQRTTDMAEYAYNELCFVFDNLRGYTSQLVLGDNNLLTLGLNGYLEKYYPTLKTLLLSKDKSEYYTAIYILFMAIYDGGHTGILANSKNYKGASIGILSHTEFIDIMRPAMTEGIAKPVKKTNFVESRVASFEGAVSEKDTKYYIYDEMTKTAYLGFDSFVIDYTGWDNYYNNLSEDKIPVNTDTYAYIRSKFYQALDDGAENLVIDITTNGGGNTAALEGIVGLLNRGYADFNLNNTFNVQRQTEYDRVDINLDGKFDNKDGEEAAKFKFNIGILTSGYAFSCGNLLPSVLKELGYKTMGERTGGGSCAVSITTTAEGLEFVHSSYICLSDASGHNIDDGVPVDFAIEAIPKDDGTYNYSNYFNFELVSNYLKTAYVD